MKTITILLNSIRALRVKPNGLAVETLIAEQEQGSKTRPKTTMVYEIMDNVMDYDITCSNYNIIA